MSTPAERGADALVREQAIRLDGIAVGLDSLDDESRADAINEATAVLRAALDDPDALARVIGAHSALTVAASPPVWCRCGQRWVEDHDRHVADAVRAWLLGADL